MSDLILVLVNTGVIFFVGWLSRKWLEKLDDTHSKTLHLERENEVRKIEQQHHKEKLNDIKTTVEEIQLELKENTKQLINELKQINNGRK